MLSRILCAFAGENFCLHSLFVMVLKPTHNNPVELGLFRPVYKYFTIFNSLFDLFSVSQSFKDVEHFFKKHGGEGVWVSVKNRRPFSKEALRITESFHNLSNIINSQNYLSKSSSHSINTTSNKMTCQWNRRCHIVKNNWICSLYQWHIIGKCWSLIIWMIDKSSKIMSDTTSWSMNCSNYSTCIAYCSWGSAVS